MSGEVACFHSDAGAVKPIGPRTLDISMNISGGKLPRSIH